MKKNLVTLCLAICLFSPGLLMAATYTVGLSTGIHNTTGQLLPIFTTKDDTWTVKVPGSSVFQDLYCGSGIFESYSNTYSGKSLNVRWLSPFLLPSGQHKMGTQPGYYEYKMTFQANPCGNVNNPHLYFTHIGGDNYIDEILVNGTSIPVMYGCSNINAPLWGSNVTIPLAPSDIWSGTNTVIVKVFNVSGINPNYTGMEIDGYLRYSDDKENPSFCLNLNNGTLQGSSSVSGASHVWNVYSIGNGLNGPYTHLRTFTEPSFTLHSMAGCFYVTHSISNDCGEVCDAKIICNASCEDKSCNLEAPEDLVRTPLDFTTDDLSWGTVTNAVSYVLVITADDPACCPPGEDNGGLMQAPKVLTIPVQGNNYVINRHVGEAGPGDVVLNCYSWYVYAICPDGTRSHNSQLMCSDGSTPGGGGNNSPLRQGSGNNNNQNLGLDKEEAANGQNALSSPELKNGSTEISVFPNPAKGQVSFDISTSADIKYSIQVYDIKGKLVKSFKNIRTTNKKSNIKWNTESLSKGTYLVTFSIPGKADISKKLIVE